MGLVFSDGFDMYGASSELAHNWGSIGSWTWNATAGRNGGGGLTITTTASSIRTLSFWSTSGQITICGAFWFKLSANPATQPVLIDFRNGSDASMGAIAVTTTGLLRLLQTANTTLTTGVTTVSDNNWHWIEFQAVTGTNANGTQKCYVDGVQQWNGSFNLNSITAGSFTYINITSPATSTWTFDDIIFYDNIVAQSPQSSDIPLGQRQINSLSPSADSSVQFTPSTGSSNSAMVDDVSADDDSTYVQDDTSGHADEYDYADLSFTPATITSVQLVSRVKNPGSGTVSYKNRCHSSSTTSDSASILAAAAYRNDRTIYNQDPATTSAWTPTNLNAAKFGVTVV